jgi:hypothetical protein
MEKIFFCILTVSEEKSWIRIHESEIRIWIRIKMLRIPNTASLCEAYKPTNLHTVQSYILYPISHGFLGTSTEATLPYSELKVPFSISKDPFFLIFLFLQSGRFSLCVLIKIFRRFYKT